MSVSVSVTVSVTVTVTVSVNDPHLRSSPQAHQRGVVWCATAMNASAPHQAHCPPSRGRGIPSTPEPRSAVAPALGLQRGRLLLVLSSFLFGIMAILAKHAALEVSGPQVAFIRFVVGAVGCALYATRRPLRIHNRLGVFLRGFFGALSVLCFFLAIWKLPVGMATLLNYTAPVFTAVLPPCSWASRSPPP